MTTAIPASVEYFDLGAYTRTITTTNPDAQIWFSRGLNWVYGFNHDEASRCFEQAALHDPGCAIAYWGVAYASGPNYNKVWQAFDDKDLADSLRKCRAFAQKALDRIASASPVEQAFISAIQCRFPQGEHPSDDAFASSASAYANAMRQAYRDLGGHDLDVVTLAADALMNMAPWSLFEPRTGRPNLNTPVLEITDILDRGIKLPGSEKHPGILHMYIHLKEMSSTPEAALLAADKLRSLVPHSGHMQHMPSHIDILIGDYRAAIASNARAIKADAMYYEKFDKPFYRIYQLHDHHSLIYAAMLAGQYGTAMEAVDLMEAILTDDILRIESPPMADWTETFKSVRVHVLIRFGKWEEIKHLTIPTDQELYCVTTAMIHYGKAIAWAATNGLLEADRERELYLLAVKRVPVTRLDFPNKVVDVLGVATAMLDGEIAYRQGNFSAAFERLRDAVHLDDSLVYSEPWGWMLPTRHAYGALLLERGHVEEAMHAYAEDLGLVEGIAGAHQHPDNVWALHGLHECLRRLGRTAEANMVGQSLKRAMAGADVPVMSSCFCRLDTAEGDTCCNKTW